MHLGQLDLLDYISDHSTAPPQYLLDLERASFRRVTNGKMISGRVQGRILAMLSRLLRPKVILDVGTFTGYSALCLAEGLTQDGQLFTIERNEELVSIQDEFWSKSPYQDQIIRLQGDAVDIIKKTDFRPELTFLDADKEIYPALWDILKERMPSGAVILADNTLWHGKVLAEEESMDHETAELIKFNKMVSNDPDFETVILPLRDGLSMIRKK